tara:strand:- start:1952 stop:2143 length:192 start_codon:yes stop_codon:yes gene_type:complete
MITIDDVEYSAEEMSEESKIRAQQIDLLRSEHIKLVLRQQEVEVSINFHAGCIKREMEPDEED